MSVRFKEQSDLYIKLTEGSEYTMKFKQFHFYFVRSPQSIIQVVHSFFRLAGYGVSVRTL